MKQPKRGGYDAAATSTVLWLGFGVGLVTGLSLSVMYLAYYSLQ